MLQLLLLRVLFHEETTIMIRAHFQTFLIEKCQFLRADAAALFIELEPT